MTLAAYLPIDRFHALAHQFELPDKTEGAALFADISSFTPLAEALTHELGASYGAEVLTRYLNNIYEVVIKQIKLYHGTVVFFSGDAVTCWFDGEQKLASHRALTAAIAIQEALPSVAKVITPAGHSFTLALKIAIASGYTRRFRVGKPEVQYMDVLAGATIERMAKAESIARRGEVIAAEEVCDLLEEYIQVAEWRTNPTPEQDNATQFAVICGLSERANVEPWQNLPENAVPIAELQRWLLPAVYERVQAGFDAFLTELRPAVALFVHFEGINYDEDEQASAKLNAFIGWVQDIVNSYGGCLLNLTIGDKGSYLYIAFGAPTAHQNDAERAVRSGVALLSPPPELSWLHSIRIGISQGLLRTGAYGSTARQSYSVLGDEVNVAARLMQEAAEWQILVTSNVRKGVDPSFLWESLPPLPLKGKSETVPIFKLNSVQEKRPIKLADPSFELPMVGRVAELELLQQKITEALEGNGQIVAITGEAGIGKSRFVAEAVKYANAKWMIGYGSSCQSYSSNGSYAVWRDIWWAFFGISPHWELRDQIEALEIQLQLTDPLLAARLPLLAPVLNIPIPDNDLTASLDKQFHKASREALLVDCIKARAQSNPLLLVIDDCHWLDPLSYDLLDTIGRAISNLPVLILMAYRPPEAQDLLKLPMVNLPHSTKITLNKLNDQEVKQFVELRLGRPIASPKLAQIIATRAEGNPFYIEELLSYLQDKGILLNDSALERMELPNTLQNLVLSRVDQLSEGEKGVLKVASVIGRVFKAQWLWEIYPSVGQPNQVKDYLARLEELGIVQVDVPEPELAYVFKHAVTQEVAYQVLPVEQRQILHELIAHYMERSLISELDRWLDTLAFHYERSNNAEKQREYFCKAGENAQTNFANLTAINYYKKLLPLLENSHEQVEFMGKLGEVHRIIGQWEEAAVFYHSALTIAEMTEDWEGVAACNLALGKTFSGYGHFDEALETLEKARQVFTNFSKWLEVCTVLTEQGNICRLRGDYGQAKLLFEDSLTVLRRIDDKKGLAHTLTNLGSLEYYAGDYAACISYHGEALQLHRDLNNKLGVAAALNSIGDGAYAFGNYDIAYKYLQESLTLKQTIGDKWGIATVNNSLGIVAFAQGNYEIALKYYQDSIDYNRRMGDKWGIANTVNNLSLMAYIQGNYRKVMDYMQENLQLYRELKAKTLTVEGLVSLSSVAANRPGAVKYATMLAAAVEGLQESTAFVLEPVYRREWDTTVAKLKTELDRLAFETTWEAGKALTLDEVLDLALADVYVAN